MIAGIQIRRGTAAAWTAAAPVLLAGEQGLETDTGRTKRGDGATAWAALPYLIDTATANSTYVPLSQRGAASGVATLDAGGLVPAAQIPSVALSTVWFAAATAPMTVTEGWSPVTGAAVTVACGGASDVFMVTAVFDVDVTTAGATYFNGALAVEGAIVSFYNVAAFGLNAVGRATVTAIYVVTGLAAGNRVFGLSGVKSVALGVATVKQDSTTITVLKVR